MPAETSNFRFIILISVIATIGGFLFGFDSGVINGTVNGLQTAFNSSSVGTGFNVASMLLGCAVGAFFAGTLADKLGRRTILIAASICFTISAWGSGIAEASAQFVFYRIIGGLAVGAASVLAPASSGWRLFVASHSDRSVPDSSFIQNPTSADWSSGK
jgi:SP family sugar:H+ symporter-like MFS transporter